MPSEKIKFIEVDLPVVEHKAELIANKPEELANRTIKLDLTRRLRGKNVEMIFKIKVKEGKAIATPHRLRIFKFFIRRVIRKSADYIEDSFQAECKNAVLRIKHFLITRKKVSRAVRRAVWQKARVEINEAIKEKTSDEIFHELLSGKFQKELSLKLKKVYPLAFCDIIDIYVEKEK